MQCRVPADRIWCLWGPPGCVRLACSFSMPWWWGIGCTSGNSAFRLDDSGCGLLPAIVPHSGLGNRHRRSGCGVCCTRRIATALLSVLVPLSRLARIDAGQLIKSSAPASSGIRKVLTTAAWPGFGMRSVQQKFAHPPTDPAIMEGLPFQQKCACTPSSNSQPTIRIS
jgi:hypothetical protein